MQTIVDKFFKPGNRMISTASALASRDTKTLRQRLKTAQLDPYLLVYEFTLSPHSLRASKATLEDCVRCLLKTKAVQDVYYIYETSPKGKLHIHGYVVTRGTSQFKKSIHKSSQTVFKVATDLHYIAYMFKGKPSKMYEFHTPKKTAFVPQPKKIYLLRI